MKRPGQFFCEVSDSVEHQGLMKKRKHSKCLDVHTRGVPKFVMTLLNLVQQKILPNIEFGLAPQHLTVWLTFYAQIGTFAQ